MIGSWGDHLTIDISRHQGRDLACAIMGAVFATSAIWSANSFPSTLVASGSIVLIAFFGASGGVILHSLLGDRDHNLIEITYRLYPHATAPSGVDQVNSLASQVPSMPLSTARTESDTDDSATESGIDLEELAELFDNELTQLP